MNRKLKTAFTLIELLVVIAIVGILSGLIIVGMSSSVNSARIAKAQIFASSLRDSLLGSLVSEWKFDGSGINDQSAVLANTTYLQDSWAQKNATIGVAPLVYSGNNCVYGSCLNYDGTSQYLNITNDAVFSFGTAMTAMVWIKTNVATGGDKSVFAQANLNSNSSWILSLVGSTGALRTYLYSDGANNRYFTTSSTVNDNKWHLIGFTWNAGTVSLYIDGQSASYNANGATLTSSLFNSTSNLSLGCYFSSGSSVAYFPGYIDEARLYSSAVPASQIKEQYYIGLNRLLANNNLSKIDYRDEISGHIK